MWHHLASDCLGETLVAAVPYCVGVRWCTNVAGTKGTGPEVLAVTQQQQQQQQQHTHTELAVACETVAHACICSDALRSAIESPCTLGVLGRRGCVRAFITGGHPVPVHQRRVAVGHGPVVPDCGRPGDTTLRGQWRTYRHGAGVGHGRCLFHAMADSEMALPGGCV